MSLFLSNSTLWWSNAVPVLSVTSLMRWTPSWAAPLMMAHAHCPGWIQPPPRETALIWINRLLLPIDLTRSPSPPTHRARNQLDLFFTRSCSTSALSVTPLTVSDHHAVTFFLPLKFTTSLAPTPHTVSTRHNLKSLSLSLLSPLLLFPHYHPQINSL